MPYIQIGNKIYDIDNSALSEIKRLNDFANEQEFEERGEALRDLYNSLYDITVLHKPVLSVERTYDLSAF
jgi:hypothetical protein